MAFQWPGPPEDPAYTHFVTGISAHWGETELPERWRWLPKNNGWYSYPLDKYALEDVGLPDSQKAVGFTFGGGAPTFFGSQLVDLFHSTQNAYAGFAQRYPWACWDPSTGEWRTPTAHSATTTPTAQKTLPKEALDQIAEIRSLVAAGTIPPDEGDRLVAKVVEKWTT